MATPYNQYNRPMSTEMGDQWSKNELDDMLRPPTWAPDDQPWTNQFGQDYDADDPYGNLMYTPDFAGGAGEAASDAWQSSPLPGSPGGGGGGTDPTDDPTNGGDENGKPDWWGDLTAPWEGTFQAPTAVDYPDAPEYRGPDMPTLQDFQYEKFQAPDEFKAPTMAEAQAAPGFQMRMDQGRKALEASAAAKGMLRSGQTYADLTNYGQKMGEMGYQDVYGRPAQEYDRMRRNLERDYATQYGVAKDIYGAGRRNVTDLYGMERQEARDRYAPQLAQWGKQFGATQRQRELDYNRAWEEQELKRDIFESNQRKKRTALRDLFD